MRPDLHRIALLKHLPLAHAVCYLDHLPQLDRIDRDAVGRVLQRIRDGERPGDENQLPVVLVKHHIHRLRHENVAKTL